MRLRPLLRSYRCEICSSDGQDRTTPCARSCSQKPRRTDSSKRCSDSRFEGRSKTCFERLFVPAVRHIRSRPCLPAAHPQRCSLRLPRHRHRQAPSGRRLACPRRHRPICSLRVRCHWHHRVKRLVLTERHHRHLVHRQRDQSTPSAASHHIDPRRLAIHHSTVRRATRVSRLANVRAHIASPG